MIVDSIYSFIEHELRSFPSTYFDIARKLSINMETESSIMNGLAIIFGFFMMFGGIGFFIGATIIVLPLILVFVTVTIASEYIQKTIFPNHGRVLDLIAIPVLLLLIYYFGHTYISFIFIPAFNFSLEIILSILCIPLRYSG